MRSVRSILHPRNAVGVVLVALAVLAGMGCVGSAAAAGPVFKCVADGSVSYQSQPCPTGQARPQPTVQQLNAQRQRQQAQQAQQAQQPQRVDAAQAAGNAAPAAVNPAPDSAPAPGRPAPARSAAAEPLPGAAGYRCDGRRRCTQMTSCAEAQYFLAHCPGVELDGDGNGIPCERQWCGGASASSSSHDDGRTGRRRR